MPLAGDEAEGEHGGEAVGAEVDHADHHAEARGDHANGEEQADAN